MLMLLLYGLYAINIRIFSEYRNQKQLVRNNKKSIKLHLSEKIENKKCSIQDTALFVLIENN